jgi:hypothetical protein
MSFNISVLPLSAVIPQACLQVSFLIGASAIRCMQLLIARNVRRERLHDGAGDNGGTIFARFIRTFWSRCRPPAGKATASAGRTLLFLNGNTCVLVAVLRNRLSRPGRHG